MYTYNAKLEDTKLGVEKLGDGRLEDKELEDGALNDAELDDTDLTHMYAHVSELADDTKNEELANSEDDSDSDDSEDEDDNKELEELMDADLMPAGISELGDEDDIKNEDINDNDEDGNDYMPDDLMRVKQYLSTLQRLDRMTDRAFGALRRYATKFLIYEGLLFQRSKPNMLPKRVIWDKNEQTSIIQQMHNESGHRGKKGTYGKIALHCWWKGLYHDVEK